MMAMFSDIPQITLVQLESRCTLESASCQEEEQKALVGSPLSIFWAIWKERNRVVFKEASFSHIRLKHSIISPFLYWVGIIPNVDISFVRTLPSLYMTDPRS